MIKTNIPNLEIKMKYVKYYIRQIITKSSRFTITQNVFIKSKSNV